jgi:hypothetical protein
MTDLFYGGEIGSVTPSSGSVYEATLSDGGSATIYNSSNARCAIRINSSAAYAESPAFSGQSEIWTGWQGWYDNSAFSTTVTILELMAGSTAQVRLRWSESGSGTVTLQYNNAGTWTTVGSTHILTIQTLHKLDVHLKISTDELEFYAAGTRVIYNSGSADLSGLSSITSVRWYGVASSQAFISELIGATTTTIGSTIKTRYPNGAGNSTAWTGTYEDVDEVVYSDTDGISSSAGNDQELFTHTGATLTGLVIRGVAVAARAKLGASGPTGLKGLFRIGSTDYAHATAITLAAGYGAHVHVSETSPATATTWTAAEVAAAQYGHKSIT